MPDLMKTPSNRRYVVNFQHKEPKNKYDIWLSFNKHEQGNQVIVDSEQLADKDLVFKVYMNGKWIPILGIPISYEGITQIIEELKKNKMNIVPSNIWSDGDIPIFHQGPDSCDQLISGGDIGTIIQNYLNGGDPIPIQRATTSTLGGVKAAIHTHEDELDQYVEARFKGAEGAGENDRLYVSAAEIIQAIKIYIGGGGDGFELQLMGPNTRGGAKANAVPVSWNPDKYIPILINQTDEHMYVNGEDILSVLIYILENDPLTSIYEDGEGIDITDNTISLELAEESHIGGIKARPHGTQLYQASGNPAVEACIVTDANPVFLTDVLYNRIIPPRHLAITKGQIYSLLNYQDEYTAPMFRSGFGIQPHAWHEYNTHTGVYDDWYTFDLIHGISDYGKILKIADDGSGIEWIPVPTGGQSYDPLTANSSLGDECVIVAPGPSGQNYFLRGDGVFAPIPSSGSTVTINSLLHTGIPIAEYTIDNNRGTIYAPTSGSTYYPGDGILIDRSNNISIDTTNARDGWVLGYNISIPGVEWVPQTSYTAGVGINIDATEKKIEARITESRGLVYTSAETSIHFRVYQPSPDPSQQIMRQGVDLLVDGNLSTKLQAFTYTNLIFTPTNSTKYELSFAIEHQPAIMYGNPVYCLLQIEGKPDAITVEVTTSEFGQTGLINVNEAVIHDVQNDRSKLNPYCNHYLITMQLGIVKIEPLEATIVSSNSGGGGTLEPAG